MNRRKLAALLAEVLNGHIEEPSALDVPSDVWMEAARGQRSLSAGEEKVLWLSPAARARYLDARQSALRSAREAWQARSSSDVVFLRAAASDKEEQTLHGNGWKLSITPVPASSWILTLQLDAAVARDLPVMAQLRLIDDEGVVWGQGELDGRNAIDLEWQHDEPPLSRLRRMGLRVEIA